MILPGILGVATALYALVLSGPELQQPPQPRILVDKHVGVMDTVLNVLKGRLKQLPSGAGLTGTVVYARNLRSGVRARTVTNQQGEYFLWLESGTYQVEVAQPKHPALAVKKLWLGSGMMWQLDVGLPAGRVK